MAAETQHVLFFGLDPVPITLLVTAEMSEEAMLAAACIPSSVFLQTVRPFRVRQRTAEAYELVIGPEGFGAVLLEALQWLASVTAAGIIGTMASDRVVAFVQQYLERDKPEWRFEELTEHTAAFIDDRYERAACDTEYRRGLEEKRHDTVLAIWLSALHTWVAQGKRD